ncbi:MAG: hypothetical protein H0Z37_00815 [Firmicutes bacterium]|nr:hypothetical protein [Bacillota bacterium]
MVEPQRITARIRWRGHPYTITGRLVPSFLVENGRVVVLLDQVDPVPPGMDGSRLWVAAADVAKPHELDLRSRIWELPGGPEKDRAARTVAVALSERVRGHGIEIRLGRDRPSGVELVFAMDVPLDGAVDYLWGFQAACRYCTFRELRWRPPAVHLASAQLDAPRRARAAHSAAQLPLWLTSRQFWSAFRWESGRLVHIVQFSLDERLRRTVQARFHLETAPGTYATNK